MQCVPRERTSDLDSRDVPTGGREGGCPQRRYEGDASVVVQPIKAVPPHSEGVTVALPQVP